MICFVAKMRLSLQAHYLSSAKLQQIIGTAKF